MSDFLQISFGTASLVALSYALWPNLTHKDVRYRKQAWYAVGAFVSLTAALSVWGPSGAEGSTLRQSDVVQISGRSDRFFEVFYPQAFQRAPNLKIRFVKGQGTVELFEQRADGFKFKTRDVSYDASTGAEVEWVADGARAE